MINLDTRLLDALTGEEIGLFVHILKRINLKKKSWPGRNLLMKETGYGKDKLSKCLQGLFDKNIISSEQIRIDGKFSHVEYTIETELAGVFISAQGHKFIEKDDRDTGNRTTINRNTENRILSINKKKSINKYNSVPKNSANLFGDKSTQPKFKRTKKRKSTIPDKNKPYFPLSKQLYDTVLNHNKNNLPKTRINEWADQIRKIHKIDKIAIVRIEKVLDWYEDNIGEPFVPLIFSGATLREKFIRLEAAKQRKENGNGNGVGSRRYTKNRLDPSIYEKASRKMSEINNN